jgi:hypothetical protein
MQLPPGGWIPRPRRASSVQARGEVFEGFEIVRTEAGDSTSGFSMLHVPALNMFTVYREIRNCVNIESTAGTTSRDEAWFQVRTSGAPAGTAQ